MAKRVPLDDKKPKKFKFGTFKGALTDEHIKAIEAPLPGDILDVMLNGPIESGDKNEAITSLSVLIGSSPRAGPAFGRLGCKLDPRIHLFARSDGLPGQSPAMTM